MIRKLTFVLTMSLVMLQLTACGGGGGSGAVIAAVQIEPFNPAENAGSSTELNLPGSIIKGGTTTGGVPTSAFDLFRIDIQGDNTPLDTLGDPITMPPVLNYMVNDVPSGPSKDALIVFISGGYMNTRLDQTDVSNVFVTRSAHLFAENGYKTVNIEQPSDMPYYFPAPTQDGNGDDVVYDPSNPPSTETDPNHYAWYDDYRASPDHCKDVKRVIEAVNITGIQNIILVGYGRGAISAAAIHHNLTEQTQDLCDNTAIPVTWDVRAIVMVSPSTNGGNAFLSTSPIPTDRTYSIPVFITYHDEDQCIARGNDTAAQTINDFRKELLLAGNSFDIMAVAGGFESPEPNPTDPNDPYEACGALTHHGFLGVEEGTVNMITNWIDGLGL